MSVIDDLKAKVHKWLFSVALKKAIKRLAQLTAAYVAAKGLAQYGISVTEEQATAAIYALAEVLRNYLKHKWPERFGWL